MADGPRLLALKTAVPPFVLEQDAVAKIAEAVFGGHTDIQRMLPVFANTGIARRYSCVPPEWYLAPHGWKDRDAIFRENAVELLAQVTDACLDEAGLQRHDIDAVVTVTTTGVLTPSLDALIMERLSLRRDVVRLPIFGFGCAGGVSGLSRAGMLATAMPGKNILFLAVELCALTFRKDDTSKSNIVATALFGDGAAGAILSTTGEGPRLGASYEHTWPGTLDIMGWGVEEDGLRAIFSQSIPSLVNAELESVLGTFLCRNGLTLSDFDAFACHPGGAKVLSALERTLRLEEGGLADSRSVLRDYGNMSSVTVLFVLERMKIRERRERVLMSTLGPGFTAAFQILEGR
jgi:alkylresorcinol/alkylpyrone synthase